MATPANRVPVRIARGTKANLDTAMAASDLKEGEICYATDEDVLYVVESSTLVSAGGGGGGGGGIDTTGYNMDDGRLTAYISSESAYVPYYPKGRPQTETSTTATYALEGPDGSNYADQAAWEAAGWTFVTGSINADDLLLNFNPDATWLEKYKSKQPMGGELPDCTDDQWTINSNGGIAWGGQTQSTSDAATISSLIDAYFAPMSQDGKMQGCGHKIVTVNSVDYLVVRMHYQPTYNTAGSEIPIEVWFSESGGTEFRYGSKIGTPSFTISANNQGIFTKGTAISFDGTTTALLGDGTTDLSTYDGGGGVGSDPAGYVVRYQVGPVVTAQLGIADLIDYGNYFVPPEEARWLYDDVNQAQTSGGWYQDGVDIIKFARFDDLGNNKSGSYPNVGLVGGTGVTVTLWLSEDQINWTAVTGETVNTPTTIDFTTSPAYQVTSPSNGSKLYVSTTDPGFVFGGPKVDKDLLRFNAAQNVWSPISLAEAIIDEASNIRAELGIGEYADDTAAGSGGVASGALYYNTTSSDYRLKT